MISRGVKARLVAFVVLAAVGIVYVAGTYLGLVDKLLGRGLELTATLPSSGGLFEGSEVTLRGVKVGTVGDMRVTDDGLEADLHLDDGTEVPLDSTIHVHNLSAVGEQYLDIVPESEAGARLAQDGDTLHGNPDSLPVDEGALLVNLSQFVNSVDKDALATTVSELGTAFHGTAYPLRGMVDGADRFLQEAIRNEEATFRLLDSGQVVLQTQAAHAGDIRRLAKDLADLTEVVRARDPQLRTILEGGGATAQEVTALMQGLEPTLPVFIGDLVTLNQIVTTRLPAVEQLLVTFPRMVSSGFTGTPGDGYGHINLQLDNSVGACRKGYQPSSQWRPPSDLTDTEVYPAKCLEGPPVNLRGTKYAPAFGGSGNRVAPYDPASGMVLDDSGRPMAELGRNGGLETVFGDDSWRWLLIGPTGAVR